MARDAHMSDLIAVNPNVEQQMRDWQTERHQKGESPFEWAAFRDHEARIGAADPGEQPPPEFYWFAPPAMARARVPAASGTATLAPSTAPSAVLVSPETLRASAPGDSGGLSLEGDRPYYP
jgi:hypothetical protein